LYIGKLTIITPIVEECIFRGFMYAPFQRRIGPLGSICMCAIIWALCHSTTTGFLPLFILGIILGYLYKNTKSLIPGLVFHGLFNLSPIIFFLVFQK
ncbi:MAG: CPBP family intramembrane metalloprotease, partial [Desulfobacula sp.]|nr:CPBP family intramembrane metalloprotease [Desulfobacula sp.]